MTWYDTLLCRALTANYYPQEDSQKQDFICTLRQLVNEGTDNDSISYNAAVILAQSHHSSYQCERRLRLALQNGSSQQKSKVRVWYCRLINST